MSTRSEFLRSSLLLAGGLLLGDAALEAFERLTHRKVFALGYVHATSLADLSRKTHADVIAGLKIHAATTAGLIRPPREDRLITMRIPRTRTSSV